VIRKSCNNYVLIAKSLFSVEEFADQIKIQVCDSGLKLGLKVLIISCHCCGLIY
jgi:hypothetical protein